MGFSRSHLTRQCRSACPAFERKTAGMKISDFDYELPPRLIAQSPVEPRDSSRLMVLDRDSGEIAHHRFHELEQFLNPGDVLILNDTRVIPARLAAGKLGTGGKVEILLLRQLGELDWLALVRGKGVRAGVRLQLPGKAVQAVVLEVRTQGQRVLRFNRPLATIPDSLGQTPLPPYIHTRLQDGERYQTVYSRHPGSAAAPTAGLHFTTNMLERLQSKGVRLANCTLHIGLDTFQPVRVDDVNDHQMHSEEAWLGRDAVATINAAVSEGKRVVAVGTTAARTLESAATGRRDAERVAVFEGDTSLFITPGYRWQVVDALLTNFHLPRSTLLMMVSALAGRESILNAYRVAMKRGYRFYSLGDAMFIGSQT